jgi:hypothetical protein
MIHIPAIPVTEGDDQGRSEVHAPRLSPSLRGHGQRLIGHDGRPYPPVLGGPAARWRSETRAWHEELLAVVRLPDAAARRRCEATL